MRCRGMTQKGKRCKKSALPQSKYCRVHCLDKPKKNEEQPNLIFTDALYYPFIDIPDKVWLRTAILYWNSISTIIPESVKPFTDKDSRYLHDAGILTPLFVHSRMPELQEVAYDVISCIDTEEGRKVLVPSGDDKIFPIHNDKFWFQLQHNVRMHSGKISPELLQVLGGKANRIKGSWLNLPKSFAGYYMTLLATHLARTNGKALLTDEYANDVLAEKVTLGSMQSNRRFSRVPGGNAEGVLAKTVFQTINIKPNTSFNKIVEFREKNETELARFRTAIRELMQGFSGDITTEAFRSHTESIYRDKVKPAIEDLHGKLKDKGNVKYLL